MEHFKRSSVELVARYVVKLSEWRDHEKIRF